MRATPVVAALIALAAFTPSSSAKSGCHTRACAARTCHTRACKVRVAWKRISPADRAWLESTARCESHGDYRAISAGGRYRGRYQFDRGSWRRAGGIRLSGTSDPALASPHAQDVVALRWRAMIGTGAWPVCG